MMEVVQGEAAARPRTAVDLGGKGEEDEREELLATTTEDAEHNGGKAVANAASHFDVPPGPGEDPAAVRGCGRNGSGGSAGNYLEAAPTNGVAASR